MKDKHVNEITNLHGKINEMIPLSEVERINNEHNNQIESLQKQLWGLNDQLSAMVPTSEMQKLKSRSSNEKQKLGQEFETAQGLIGDLKSKLEETERHYKDMIMQIRHEHRDELAELNIEHEKKII